MNPSRSATELRPADRRLLRWYDRLWRLLIPLLKFQRRLAVGYDQRCLSAAAALPPAHLWWQAASAGEAFLAVSLASALHLSRPTRLLVTTQTRQGYDILMQQAQIQDKRNAPLRMTVRYLPFDRPALMRRAVAQVRPRLAVLLETELWPGFMGALKSARIPLAVINARMGPRSQRHYRLRPSLWRALRPEVVMALSADDARRFASVFGSAGVTTMPNIKFDRVNTTASEPSPELRQLVSAHHPLVVLGSVRRAEEAQVAELISALHRRHPTAILALFPRHMERLGSWQRHLKRRSLPWILRSKANGADVVLNSGGILLWDTFGELGAAYALARGAYVGGSLVPLGGQNFLEPLAQGIRPVIGPYWDNFAWVGRGLIRAGLVQEVGDPAGAFQALCTALERPSSDKDKAVVRSALDAYLASRRGGSAQAAGLIRRYLV
ncbi:MAG: glycosyltransferase N-terminal domain-containing protein [Desulfosarcinaceae bacterium]|nr:glycosyltransferase N-terminal domain-containing protein [Desulfosarcinaceae bacterium]